LVEAITKGQFDFPSPYWDDISDLGKNNVTNIIFVAKDLIKKLLCVDPKKRLSPNDILSHAWIVGDVTPRKNLTSLPGKIKEYNLKKKLKVLILEFRLIGFRKPVLLLWQQANGQLSQRNNSRTILLFFGKFVFL
jgi:Protein kinase domain.